MPETLDPGQHVKPFVYENLTSKALLFSICEIQSRMRLEDPYALDLEYTRTMMGFLLFQPDPKQIAMIGLGGGSLAKFCHRHLPRARIQVVEINPHVISLRDEFHVPPDDERFRVIHGDAEGFGKGLVAFGAAIDPIGETPKAGLARAGVGWLQEAANESDARRIRRRGPDAIGGLRAGEGGPANDGEENKSLREPLERDRMVDRRAHIKKSSGREKRTCA